MMPKDGDRNRLTSKIPGDAPSGRDADRSVTLYIGSLNLLHSVKNGFAQSGFSAF